MKKLIMVLCLIGFAQLATSQLTTFDWPNATGQALLSDKYDVYVKVGTGTEQKLEVLMSNAIYEGDWMANELQGRTFSFVTVDYNTNGAGLTFRIVKKFGNNASSVNIAPKSYNLNANMNGGKEVSIGLDANNKYFSVDFVSGDNRTANKGWIKHMLCIFVDPPETGKPNANGTGVVKYSNTISSSALQNADIIYFQKGYHNLRNYQNGGVISDGILTLQDDQELYFEGGAFVDGLIDREDYNNSNQKLYGRGVLSGRKFPWYNKPGYSGPRYQQIVKLGAYNAEVNGITVMESPSHGVVGNKVDVTNLKIFGWHSNNDCVRVGSESEIKNCFLRAVDDHFYNFNIWVHQCVLWAGHNGGILTYGWGGDDGPTYNSGSSLLEDIDIINCEWVGLGNNQGIVAAQTGLDYKPYGYGGDPTTILRNIRIEGSIPGLLNLKPRSENDAEIIARKVAAADVGFLGDLQLINITVEDQFLKGRMKGTNDAAYDQSNVTYYVQDVNFDNVYIEGSKITSSNVNNFFDIESSTTKNITFSGSSPCATPGGTTVSKTNATCGQNNGSITFTFADDPNRTGIKFSINGESNYTQVNDNTGSYTFNNLSEGTYNCYVAWGNDDCPTNLGNVTVDCNGGSNAIAIPGIVEAEDFSSQSGVQTETCSEGGLNVGWIDNGDWMDYDVDVASAGDYTVEFRVAANSSNISLDLKKGTNVLTSVNNAATGGWQTWTTVTKTLTLQAGVQTLRIQATGGGWNINRINFTAQGSGCATPGNTSISKTDATCGGSDGSITFTFADDPNRTGIKFSINGGNNYTQVNDNTGSYTFNNLSEGTYSCYVAWGNDDCPTSLGNITIGCADNVQPGLTVRIENVETGLWLRPLNDVDLAEVECVSNTNTGNRTMWEIEDAGDGYWRFKNVWASRRLRPVGSADNDMMEIGKPDWLGNWTHWSVESTGNGVYKLTNRTSLKYFRPQGDNSGTMAIQVPTSDNSNYTKWRLIDINKSAKESGLENNHTSLSIFPNPANNTVTITIDQNTDTQFNIINLSGQTVLSSTIQDGFKQVDVTGFKPGIYIVQIAGNEHTIIKRLIIE